MILAAVGALVGMASTAMSFYSQYQSAKELKKLAAYRMKAAEQEAKNVTLQSHENVGRERVNAKTYLSEVQTSVAGMSGMVNADSLLESQAQAASTLEMHIQDAARAEKMRASNIMRQAAVGAYEDNQRAAATKISALSDAISGAARIMGSIDFKSASARNTGSRYDMTSLITPVSDYSSKSPIINATK